MSSPRVLLATLGPECRFRLGACASPCQVIPSGCRVGLSSANELLPSGCRVGLSSANERLPCWFFQVSLTEVLVQTVKKGLATWENLTGPIAEQMAVMEDLMLDVPMAPKLMANLIASVITESGGALTLDLVKTLTCEPSRPNPDPDPATAPAPDPPPRYQTLDNRYQRW
eukprot:1195697-Prorocentrum_minimum.AAC.4